MEVVKDILIGLVAALHFYFMWLEMFGWERGGPKLFNLLPNHQLNSVKNLAAYQGLHHGFLGAGLLWSFSIANEEWSSNVALFFLGCIILAAIFSAMTVSRNILALQGIPAVLAMTVAFIVRCA